jgi:hypothetical protein
MAPTTLMASDPPPPRMARRDAGPPMHVSEMIATLAGATFVERCAVRSKAPQALRRIEGPLPIGAAALYRI